VREALFDTLQAYWVGAHSDLGWDMQATPMVFKGYAPSAHRYDYGSQSTSLFAGVTETINFLEEIGMDKVEARVRELSSYLQQRLLTLGDKIEMLTPVEAASRLCMVTFRIPRRNFMEFNTILTKNKFRIRVVPESDLNALRVSTHIYNSHEEIDRFFAVVKSNV
jgi:L-cysteine/cystine lyase